MLKESIICYRTRKHSKSDGNREPIESHAEGGRRHLPGNAHVNTSNAQDNVDGVSNPSYPAVTVLPDVLGSTMHIRSTTSVPARDTHGDYEEVDLTPHTGLSGRTSCRHGLRVSETTGGPQDSEEHKNNELYFHNKMPLTQRKQATAQKISADKTSPSDNVYNILSRPNVNPSAPATPDHYYALYDVRIKSTNEG